MSWSAEAPKLLQLLLGIVAFVVVVGGILFLLDVVPRIWANLTQPEAATPPAPQPERGAPPASGEAPSSATALAVEGDAGDERGETARQGTVQTKAPPTESGPPAGAPKALLPAGRRRRPPREVWIGLAFLAPAALLLTGGLIVPVLRTMFLSLQDANGQEPVGLANFGWIFTQEATLVVLRNTVVWVILAPLLATAIGLIYAILVDRVRLEWFAKSLIFLPMAISFVGASIIWRFVYADRPATAEQIGILNQVLVWLGFSPQNFMLLDNGWVDSWVRVLPGVNTLMLIVIMIWIFTGFAMVVLSAAIKAIPGDIIEAARMDGTNPWQMFWQITLPSIKPSLIVVIVTISIATLKVFDIVRTMTAGRFDTSVIANEMYTQAFIQGQLGRGSALAVVLFLFVLPLVFYQIHILRQRRLETR